MSDTNVAMFTSNGMIDSTKLTDSERDFLNALTPDEAKQLVAMWERMGKPEMPADGNVVGFF